MKRIEDKMTYALKRVKLKSLKEKEIANAINEVRILASIRHQNVIAYKEAFMEPKTESLWYEFYKIIYPISIVMEYADNGDLL